METRQVASFTVENGHRIMNATRWVERNKVPSPGNLFIQNSESILFRNDSGYTIPAYGCFQVDETVEDGAYNYLTAIRPFTWTGAALVFMFNGPLEVENGKFGTAQNGPLFRALKDSTTMSIGMRLGPTSNSFELGKGCLFSYLGTDDVVTSCIKIVRNETMLLAIADSTIAGNSSGTATVKIPSAGDWSAGTISYTVRNPSSTSIPSGQLCQIEPIDAKWTIVGIC